MQPTGMQPPPGKRRNPALVILFSILTLGVYWFVWSYKAFKELGDHRGKDLKSGLWVGLAAAVWVIYWVVSVVFGVMVAMEAIEAADQSPSGEFDTIRIQAYVDDAIWFQIVSGACVALVAIFQAVYLKPASDAVNAASDAAGLPSRTQPVFAILFNVLYAGGAIPYVGFLFSVAGIVLAIIWIVQTQGTLNDYWQGPGMYGPAPSYPPPVAQSPQPVTQPTHPAWPTPPPRNLREKTFACPQCRTHVTVNYVPGERTPVQCPQCGTRGVIR